MITFPDILKAIYREYHVDACYIADHLGLEDEEVERWEKGESVPSKEALKKFSDGFILPLKTLEEAVENTHVEEKGKCRKDV